MNDPKKVILSEGNCCLNTSPIWYMHPSHSQVGFNATFIEVTSGQKTPVAPILQLYPVTGYQWCLNIQPRRSVLPVCDRT